MKQSIDLSNSKKKHPLNTFTCIIIDDDHFVIEQLQDYINEIPFLKLVKTYTDPTLAVREIKNISTPIDFLFTDVEMPEIDGIRLSQNLTDSYRYLILISGHLKYALDGYGVNAIQFLTKPFDFKKFSLSIQSVVNKLVTEDHFIMIRLGMNKEIIKVYANKIILIQGASNYIRIETLDKTYMPYLKMSQIEEYLRENQSFLRINKSNIISSKYISSVSKYLVTMTNGATLTVSKSYRNRFNWFLKHNVCSNQKTEK